MNPPKKPTLSPDALQPVKGTDESKNSRPFPIPELEQLVREIGTEAVLEVLELFHQGADAKLEEVHSAIRAGDSRAIQSAAHALKGSALNIGATELAQLCRELEQSALQLQNTALPELIHRVEKAVSHLKFDP